MKQMTLIEMDGFLKGKCIPSDLKVNETNAEYLVRKFGELESKLETALRECRSAGITIDNLEAKCAALLDERERNQQYIKSRDQENEDIALTVGKLRVELETAKSKLKEQREYYEGVISDGSKRIAELESLTAPKLTQQEPVSVPEVVGWEDVPEEITEDDIALASAWAHGFNQCRAAMLQRSEPETDNTNQQFESLSRGDK